MLYDTITIMENKQAKPKKNSNETETQIISKC